MSTLTERLTAIKANGGQVVSCYVSLEPEDRRRAKYLIELKDAAKAIRERLDSLMPERSARRAVERDLTKILEYVGHSSDLPAARGVAIFASTPLKLFAAVPLPQVYHTRLALDRAPQLEELIATEQEFGRLLMVVADRVHARLFDVTAFEAVELPCSRSAGMRGGKYHGDRQGSPGWGEADYHNRIREEEHRHYDLVARELAARERERPARDIILAGPGTVPTTLLRFLSSALADRVTGTVRLNPPEVTPAAVYRAALDVRRKRERVAERTLATAVEQGLTAGWTVNGIEPTLGALAKGQVRVLLVRADTHRQGYRCAASGRLAASKAECSGEGEPMPVPDLVSDAIQEALRQHVSVTVIRDRKPADAIDGMAALLRFR